MSIVLIEKATRSNKKKLTPGIGTSGKRRLLILLIQIRTARVRRVRGLHIVRLKIRGKCCIRALLESLERQERTGRLKAAYCQLLHLEHQPERTQEKMAKKEKAMAALTLLTPTSFFGVADLAHWLHKYQNPTKYKNAQKAKTTKH